MSKYCSSIPQPCGGWFRNKHDWEVLEEIWRGDTFGGFIKYKRAVCLKCEHVVDEITPLLKREEAEKNRRVARKLLAEKIYNERRDK